MKQPSISRNIIYIIAAIVIAAGVLVFSQGNLISVPGSEMATEPSAGQTTVQQPSEATQTKQEQTPVQPPQQETQTITSTVVAVREFTVHGKSFEFDTKTITVNKGERVKITFISDDVSHDICVEGYGCSQVIAKGQTTALEFVAKESGNLKFYCSVDGHRVFGMEGNFKIQ